MNIGIGVSFTLKELERLLTVLSDFRGESDPLYRRIEEAKQQLEKWIPKDE